MRAEIHRIARWYGWQDELLVATSAAGAASLAGLDDHALAQLHARMRRLEACLQDGCDSPDAPHAR